MKAVRRLLSVFFALVFLSLSLVTFITATSSSVERWIKKSHLVETHLRDTAQYVSAYAAAHGRLPDNQLWRRQLAPAHKGGATLWDGPPFDKLIVAKFGAPPSTDAHPFVLGYFGGDGTEYYASWTNSTTLVLNPSEYYMLGIRRDALLYGFLAVLSLAVSVKLWPHKVGRSSLAPIDATP
jgi:hypothetical protein